MSRHAAKHWRRLAGGALLSALLVSIAAPAIASRVPSDHEKRVIRQSMMKDCRRSQDATSRYPCKWGGNVRVSTVNDHYAWASATGPQYDNSGILRHSRGTWRVVRVVGGGIQPCSYWREKAPAKVVTDLGVRGYSEGSGNFDYHRC